MQRKLRKLESCSFCDTGFRHILKKYHSKSCNKEVAFAIHAAERKEGTRSTILWFSCLDHLHIVTRILEGYVKRVLQIDQYYLELAEKILER